MKFFIRSETRSLVHEVQNHIYIYTQIIDKSKKKIYTYRICRMSSTALIIIFNNFDNGLNISTSFEFINSLNNIMLGFYSISGIRTFTYHYKKCTLPVADPGISKLGSAVPARQNSWSRGFVLMPLHTQPMFCSESRE